MSAVLEIPDDGFVTVKLGGASVQIDAYEMWNRVCEASDANADDDKPLHEFHAKVADLLRDAGFPKVSHFQADQFVKRLRAAVELLKKSTGPTPGSPASTDPESSAYQPD